MTEQRFKHKPLHSTASQLKTESMVLLFTNKIVIKRRNYEYTQASKYLSLHRKRLEGNTILSNTYLQGAGLWGLFPLHPCVYCLTL